MAGGRALAAPLRRSRARRGRQRELVPAGRRGSAPGRRTPWRRTRPRAARRARRGRGDPRRRPRAAPRRPVPVGVRDAQLRVGGVGSHLSIPRLGRPPRLTSSAVSNDPEFRYSDLLPTGTDDTPYRLVTDRGRLDLRGRRADVPAGRPRGDPAADRRGDARHHPLPAARAPRPAAQDHRRPRGVGQRPVRRARPAQERQHLRRRRAADVPGHRHRDRDGQEVRGRAHRRRRRRGDLAAACTTPTPSSTCATRSSRR